MIILKNLFLNGFWPVVKYFSAFYAVKTYVVCVDLVYLTGSSMEPTFSDGELVLAEKLSVYNYKLKWQVKKF